MAIVFALNTFSKYLLMRPFHLFSDHKPLTFLKQNKSKNARLTRWALFAQQYTFTFTHIRGSQNIISDALSRTYWSIVDPPQINYYPNKLLLCNMIYLEYTFQHDLLELIWNCHFVISIPLKVYEISQFFYLVSLILLYIINGYHAFFIICIYQL